MSEEGQTKRRCVRKHDDGVEDTSHWKIHEGGTVLYRNMMSNLKGSAKIASFDLDGTLITTKSGKKFPIDRNDWKFFTTQETLNSKLKNLVDDGFKLVIFTNQRGITTGQSKREDILGKLDDICEKLNLPFQVFVMTADDSFRKPCPGCWEFMESKCNDNEIIDYDLSFFVGDAAGRPAQGKIRKKDFNASDIKFALNIGIPFQTPDRFFFGTQDTSVPRSFPFDPRTIGRRHLEVTVEPNENQEVIILVGPPGAGKTTFVRRFFPTYSHVNQDTLKTKDKCVKACKDALDSGKSCVVDNQNRDTATRKLYVDEAQKLGISTRCFYMDVPKELCFHLNAFRMLNPSIPEHRKHKVPQMVIHSFFKNVEKPTIAEGFSSVVAFNLETFQAGPFDSPGDESLFRMFLE